MSLVSVQDQETKLSQSVQVLWTQYQHDRISACLQVVLHGNQTKTMVAAAVAVVAQ